MTNPTLVIKPDTEARTCNEAASLLFPDPKSQAFLEADVSQLNEPPKLQLLDLNDDFWAQTLTHTVFVPQEGQFRQYQKGLYEPVTESALVGQFLSNLNLAAQSFPRCLKYDSFLALKTRARLKSVVERARDLLAVDDHYFKDRQHLHLSLLNGLLEIDNLMFYPSDPKHPVKEALPVKYDPQAKCEIFLKYFLANILEPPDIDLLQRYLSQILEGINHSQSILVLSGDAGWGKSSLMKILGTLVGWDRVGIVREQIFRDEFELGHYCNKHLLYHPDMPTSFLDRKEASLFKQLVGGDPLWADTKAGRLVLEGHFPLVLACNGKPKIHLDQDSEAWLRRIVVLSFKKPDHEQHFGKMAGLIVKNEASGILNWLLEGRAKLAKDKLQLTQTPDQKSRAVNLLLGSDSPAAFVRCSIQKQKGSVVWMAELYEEYQKWCRKHSVSPSRSVDFMRMAKGTIETTFGLSPRHDLIGESGKARRGWSGLVVAGKTIESQSSLSA